MTKETRKQLADAMQAHALLKLEGITWEPWSPAPGEDLEVRRAFIGDFHIGHWRKRGWQHHYEVIDIFQGKKMLSIRNEGSGFEIVSMKRGDWESAFLLT